MRKIFTQAALMLLLAATTAFAQVATVPNVEYPGIFSDTYPNLQSTTGIDPNKWQITSFVLGVTPDGKNIGNLNLLEGLGNGTLRYWDGVEDWSGVTACPECGGSYFTRKIYDNGYAFLGFKGDFDLSFTMDMAHAPLIPLDPLVRDDTEEARAGISEYSFTISQFACDSTTPRVTVDEFSIAYENFHSPGQFNWVLMSNVIDNGGPIMDDNGQNVPIIGGSGLRLNMLKDLVGADGQPITNPRARFHVTKIGNPQFGHRLNIYLVDENGGPETLVYTFPNAAYAAANIPNSRWLPGSRPLNNGWWGITYRVRFGASSEQGKYMEIGDFTGGAEQLVKASDYAEACPSLVPPVQNCCSDAEHTTLDVTPNNMTAGQTAWKFTSQSSCSKIQVYLDGDTTQGDNAVAQMCLQFKNSAGATWFPATPIYSSIKQFQSDNNRTKYTFDLTNYPEINGTGDRVIRYTQKGTSWCQ